MELGFRGSDFRPQKYRKNLEYLGEFSTAPLFLPPFGAGPSEGAEALVLQWVGGSRENAASAPFHRLADFSTGGFRFRESALPDSLSEVPNELEMKRNTAGDGWVEARTPWPDAIFCRG